MNVIINDNQVFINIIDGLEENIKGIKTYQIKANKLNLIKEISIPPNTFTSATFIPKDKKLYVSGWFGDVETDDAFPGIFEFNLTNGKVETVLKVESQPYWFDIGDINGDGKWDIVWTDQNGLHIELN
ncbi:MAG: hypothetical protein GX075_06285 [Firmicutes bacterium]|nr:hypothetical protein [Bacillota bacterium]